MIQVFRPCHDEVIRNLLQANEQQEMQIEDEKEENADAENTAGHSHVETAFRRFEKQSVIPRAYRN